ncbi:MAG TPA: DUF4114 domain-containing protein [Cyclobacteriaceae bacterium]|nr:DUF4114 domain-containing protein [Cyclobacteriaceae bacterium]
MKIKALWSLLFIVSMVACDRDEPESQVPENIIDTEPCPTLYARILELFPENILISQDALFSAEAQKNVELVKESQVFVTYLAEGAGYRNSVAWYSYHKNNPPTAGSDLDLHVLFPDVSSDILTPGNRLQLQTEPFPAGTIVGFVLIINGWQGRVDFDKMKLYTDYQFNANKRQQHILFMEKTCGELVLAFEDNISQSETADADFNDIIFTVSDNNTHQLNTAFKSDNIVAW